MRNKNMNILLQDINNVVSILKAILFHIDSIKEEEDKEILDVHLSCIEELFPQVYNINGSTVRNLLKRGMILELTEDLPKLEKMNLI